MAENPLTSITESRRAITYRPIYKKLVVRGKGKSVKVFAFTQNSIDVYMIGFKDGMRKLHSIRRVMDNFNKEYLTVAGEGNQVACLGIQDNSLTLINGDDVFLKEYQNMVREEQGEKTRRDVRDRRYRRFNILTGR